MSLNQLVHFMYSKTQELEEAVSEEAKKLRLSDVKKEIRLHVWDYVQKDFEDGQALDFYLCQGHFKACINKNELVLTGSHDIEIARFKSKEVERYYKSLSKEIIKAKEEQEFLF